MPTAKTTPRIKLEARWAVYFRFLVDLGDIPVALERAQITTNVRNNWRWKYPEFKEQEAKALEEFDRKARRATNPVPDFLTFQKRHCAYFSRSKKKFVRAQNTWFMRDAVTHLEENNYLGIIMPPGHLKTTTFSIEYVAWNIFRDRNIRILVVQKNATEAAKIVGEVASRLTNHDYYHHLADELVRQGDEPIECPLCTYGDDFKPEIRKEAGGRWAAEGFKVTGVTSGEKDLTFEAKGVGSMIQGIRSDLIILDDVQDPDDAARNPLDAERKMGWFQRTIFGRVNPSQGQRLVVLANYFSDIDFAHKVAQLFEEKGVPVVKYPAILYTNPRTGEPYQRPRLLCPEFWSFDGLKLQRKMVGEEVWHYTYMQEDVAFDQRTFKREKLLAARSDTHRLGEIPPEVTDVFVGVDPATENYCAIVKWGLDRKTKQRYLIDVVNKKGLLTFQNVEQEVFRMCSDGRVGTVVMEGNAQQKAQTRTMDFQRELKNMGVRKFEIYHTVAGTGARSEQSNFDITTIGGFFDMGMVTLPYAGDQDSRDKVDAYIDQLSMWHTDEQGHSVKNLVRDMVMATLFAESEAFEVARRDHQQTKAPRRPVPGWVKGDEGGWAWQKKRQPRKASTSLDDNNLKVASR